MRRHRRNYGERARRFVCDFVFVFAVLSFDFFERCRLEFALPTACAEVVVVARELCVFLCARVVVREVDVA